MNPYFRFHLDPAFDTGKLPVPEIWDWDAVIKIINQLSPRMQVICAVTAAEIVLPIWEKRNQNRSNPYENTPKLAIEKVKEWIHTSGEVSKYDLDYAGKAATAAGATLMGAGATAAYSASRAALSVYSAYQVVNEAVYAIRYAASASAEDGTDKQEFYAKWWDVCKISLENDYQGWVDWVTGIK